MSPETRDLCANKNIMLQKVQAAAAAPPPPPQQPQPPPPLRNTKLCIFNESPKGCNKGAACHFAHSASELKPPCKAQLTQALEAERALRKQHEAESRRLRIKLKAAADGPEWRRPPPYWSAVQGGPTIVKGQYSPDGFNVRMIEEYLNDGLQGTSCCQCNSWLGEKNELKVRSLERVENIRIWQAPRAAPSMSKDGCAMPRAPPVRGVRGGACSLCGESATRQV